MKTILLMFDTLNRRSLPPYGGTAHAPHFERLAQRCMTFDNAFIGSMPCMPARRDLHTGRLGFLHRSWGPIEPFDDSLPEILRSNGIYSHLITDHYHYFEDGGCTYHPRYSSWEFVRGQEWDEWKGEVKDPSFADSGLLPPWKWRGNASAPGTSLSGALHRQNWVNRKYLQGSNHTQTSTFARAFEFLRANAREDNWFLQVEAFDPHEPYFGSDEYLHLYNDEYDGALMDWPGDYREVQETPAQIEHLRNRYSALLSRCDESLGMLMAVMDELRIWDDTLVIVTTDHGFLLGEHNWWGKNRMPVYNEIAHIPLFIWDPRCRSEGVRNEQIVQWIDFAPTILDFFNIEASPDMTGRSLAETISKSAPVRDYALFGLFGGHVNITDGTYVYMRSPLESGSSSLYEYTLLPQHAYARFAREELKNLSLSEPFTFSKGCPLLRIPAEPPHDSIQHEYPTMLFDIKKDYSQMNPIHDVEVEKRMIANMERLMKELDAPKEQYERIGLTEL